MDLATLIGLMVGWGALIISVYMEGGTIGSLIALPPFVLVVGGTIGAALICSPMKVFMGLHAIFRKAFFSKELDPAEVIKQIIGFTRKARREGILVLEDEARKLDNMFLQTGIQLIVDGAPAEVVRSILEAEVLSLQERHKAGAGMFDAMGGFAPTMGIIGTVMGLVHMLENLSDPSKMGHMIAAAFLATLYGVSIANLVFLPIGNKLKARSAEEVAIYEMMIEGILAIQAGDNTRIVEAKLLAFLPPSKRALVPTGE